MVFSVILVSPSANNPASIKQDLTCALATGKEYSIACRDLTGLTLIGRVPSSVAAKSAPIAFNGSTTLRIGLVESDLSPVNKDEKFCEDNNPAHNLMEVPEFPKSSASLGSLRPCKPLPMTE